MKAYPGKAKQNHQKKLPRRAIELKTSAILVSCSPISPNLILFTINIITVQKSIGGLKLVKLDLSQLALATLAQVGEHLTGMEVVPISKPTGSIPLEITVFTEFIFVIPYVSL